MVKPVARRQAAGHLRAHYRISERRASRVLHTDRSTLRYRPRPRNDVEIRCRLLELSAEYPRYGYQLLTDKLRLEGHVVNRKRVYRIYSEEGLQLPRRRRKRIRSMARVPLARAKQPNQRWSMDFLHDMLADGRKIRILAIIDEFTRECLALEVAPSIPGQRVTRVLDQIVAHRGRPEYTTVRNSPVAHSTNGPRNTASHCTSSSPENQHKTPSSSHSTALSAANASTANGSCIYRMRELRPRSGAISTTNNGRTRTSDASRPQSLLPACHGRRRLRLLRPRQVQRRIR